MSAIKDKNRVTADSKTFAHCSAAFPAYAPISLRYWVWLVVSLADSLTVTPLVKATVFATKKLQSQLKQYL